MKRAIRLLPLVLFCISLSCTTSHYKKTNNGVRVSVKLNKKGDAKLVCLEVITDNIIRVTASAEDEFPEVKSLMAVAKDRPKVEWTVAEKNNDLVLETSKVKAYLNLTSGEIRFTDKQDKAILTEEQGGGKHFAPDTINKTNVTQIQQVFQSPSDEAFYGLGQHQLGIMNYKGCDVTLSQYNTCAVIPFVVSNKNYGILWDNNSITKFGDPRDYLPLTSLKLYNSEGAPGGLTVRYINNKTKKVCETREEQQIDFEYLESQKNFPKGFDPSTGTVIWEGSMESDFTGANRFYVYCAGYLKLWIDGQQVLDRWRQCWNAAPHKFTRVMEKGKKYPVKIEWTPDGGESYLAVKWLEPTSAKSINSLTLTSEAGKHIDYYFVYGKTMDEIIAGYREITGKAPVMPKWAMGYWQSRERYKTQDEILNVVKTFREKNIPLDNIVLDWQYWRIDQWGSQKFDSLRFADPAGMMKELHEKYNTKLMISVWPKFYVNTENYKLMDSKGFLYKKNINNNQKDWLGYISTFYDPYNPEARKLFWDMVNKGIYSKGVDAWWMDASEPDVCSNHSIPVRKTLFSPNYLGTSTEYFNSFSLVNAQAMYEGQRATNPVDRVYILTRSAFAGLQRYGAATWSGDIGSRWEDMKNQIAAGVNFSMSGLPYWTMDAGGFSVEKRYEKATGEDLKEWRELQTRWLQFGSFCPIFRAHGQFPYREIFNIAPEGSVEYNSMLWYDRLRYNLMPYVYSLTGSVWLKDYTIMRGMVMDFGTDAAVLNINDQFMFGPSFLVAPVYKYKARSRQVYLPKGANWFDFYNGKQYAGGQTLNVEAPLERMPLFVKEGSIVPVGPSIQYSSQRPADTITLYVYRGADASFTLYEDENTNYNYEKGQYATIDFNYSESAKQLSIAKRVGEFKGMLVDRWFRVVWADKDNPQGYAGSQKSPPIKYSGQELKINYTK